MPFEHIDTPRRRIAIIGGGITGLSAAYHLADAHDLVLYESEPRLGGHARTLVAGKRGDQPVDTGFIVYNHVNYPGLVRMFEALDVPTAPSNMSFGASFGGGRCEYALHGLDAIFATRRHLADPRFLRMIRDILRFNRDGLALAQGTDMSIGDLLAALGTGRWFSERYLQPFSGAIWSTPTARIMDFPAAAMMEFFRNHGLLGYRGQHQWHTVNGGSREYVSRLARNLTSRGVDLRPGAPVAGVRRTPMGVEVRAKGAEWDAFDEVIFATHSDQALKLLSDATPSEAHALGAIRFQPNEAILHRDPAVMPKRRKCWASWVYTERGPQDRERISLSYWMNSLQPIPHDDPLFVTLNATTPVREELIHDTYTFAHPQFDASALEAQKTLAALNGTAGTWFAGAWMRNGFHEDGFATAAEVAQTILARATPAVAVA